VQYAARDVDSGGPKKEAQEGWGADAPQEGALLGVSGRSESIVKHRIFEVG